MINVTISLTILSRMKLPTFIKWNCPLSSSWLLCVVFHSYSNYDRTSCKQIVEKQTVASDIGLYYLSLSHKKNASLKWVKYFCCICYSHQFYCFFIELDNDWIKSGFNHMNRPYVGQKPLRLKQFFAMTRINVSFNVSYIDFNQYCT